MATVCEICGDKTNEVGSLVETIVFKVFKPITRKSG